MILGGIDMTEYIDDDMDFESFLDDSTDDSFEKQYDKLFSDDGQVDKDLGSYERDAVTGRRAKRPRMSVLNKSKVSKHEMDELFLD